MPTIYVRNVPETLYRTVQELAQANDQSMNTEVLVLLEDAAVRARRKLHRQQAMAKIEELGKFFHPLPDGVDSVALLREDRDR